LFAAAEISAEDALNEKKADLISLGKYFPQQVVVQMTTPDVSKLWNDSFY
jgi:hypothetical protein